jgi:hypothetical protein
MPWCGARKHTLNVYCASQQHCAKNIRTSVGLSQHQLDLSPLVAALAAMHLGSQLSNSFEHAALHVPHDSVITITTII